LGEYLTRTLIILALLAGTLGAETVRAQSQIKPQKIGYADTKFLIDNAPQVIAGRDTISREFRPRNDEVLADSKRLAAMEERLNDNLDDTSRTRLERDIRILRRAITRRREDLIEAVNNRSDEMLNNVQETLEMAIRIVAEQQGFDLVLTDPAVLYHSKQVDLSNAILKQLRLEYEADQQEQAGR